MSEDANWAKRPAYPDPIPVVQLTAQECPVCHGQGHVSKPCWVPGDVNEWTSSRTSYVCRVCNGGGLVWR